MHIIITGVHMEMTEAVRAYVEDKMKTLEKYVKHNDTSAKLEIELSKTTNHHQNGEVFQAEAILHMRGKDMTVRTVEDDLYKAIDTLKDMIAREMIQGKDKDHSLMKRGAHKIKNMFKSLL